MDTFAPLFNAFENGIQQNRQLAELQRTKPLRDLLLQNQIAGQQDIARGYQQQAGLRDILAQAQNPQVDTSGEMGELQSIQAPPDPFGASQDKAELDYWRKTDPSKVQGVVDRISKKAMDLEKLAGPGKAADYVSLATGTDRAELEKHMQPKRQTITVGDKQSVIEYDPKERTTKVIYDPTPGSSNAGLYQDQTPLVKIYLDSYAQKLGLGSGRQLDPIQMKAALDEKAAVGKETQEEIRKAQLEKIRLDIEAIKAGQGRGPLNPADEQMAQLLAAGKITPYELSKRAKEYHGIISRASEINPNLNIAQLVGDMNWFKSQTGQRQIRSIENVEMALPTLLKYSDAFKRTGIRAINNAWLQGVIQSGPDVVGKDMYELAVGYNTFVDEIATELGAVLAGGTPTVESTRHAREILDRNLSPEGVRAQVEASMRATGFRKEAFTLGTPAAVPKTTTRMRAPDGSEMDVPNDRVKYFLKKGATITR